MLGSKVSSAAAWRRVRPMSSRPFSRQYLRKGSMSKVAWKPCVVGDGLVFKVDGDLVVRVRVARVMRVSTSSSVRRTRMMPFLPAFEKKMSAKVGAMTARKP